MFNKRSFLAGLGFGVMIGALLLQLIHMSESSQKKLNQLSEQMENAESQSGAGEQEQQDKLEETASVQDSSESTTPPVEEQIPDQAAEADVDAAIEDHTATAQDPLHPEGAPAKGRLLRIEPGFSITRTAEFLEENGIIEDTSAFIAKMKAAKKEVRAGRFEFQLGMSTEAAIKMVTSQPLTEEEFERRKA